MLAVSGYIKLSNGKIYRPLEIRPIGGSPIGYNIRCIQENGARDNLNRTTLPITTGLGQYRIPIGKDS